MTQLTAEKGYGLGENISYGYSKPRDIMIQLAVDDGVPSRGHRTNIFKEDYQYVGTCYGPHKGYREMTVLIYGGKRGSGASYTGVEAGKLNDGSGDSNKSDNESSDNKNGQTDSGSDDSNKSDNESSDNKNEQTDSGSGDSKT